MLNMIKIERNKVQEERIRQDRNSNYGVALKRAVVAVTMLKWGAPAIYGYVAGVAGRYKSYVRCCGHMMNSGRLGDCTTSIIIHSAAVRSKFMMKRHQPITNASHIVYLPRVPMKAIDLHFMLLTPTITSGFLYNSLCQW